MKIEVDSTGRLKINGKLRHCINSDRFYGTHCAHFSGPDTNSLGAHIHLCYHKIWSCDKEDFIDNRVEVSK